jgi:hypothetical protein
MLVFLAFEMRRASYASMLRYEITNDDAHMLNAGSFVSSSFVKCIDEIQFSYHNHVGNLLGMDGLWEHHTSDLMPRK